MQVHDPVRVAVADAYVCAIQARQGDRDVDVCAAGHVVWAPETTPHSSKKK